jgi:Tfp pilus assembly protein PilF
MKSSWLWAGVLVLFCFSVIQANAQASYASEFELGMKAYKDFHYEEATEHFRRATEIDPNQMEAHLYLASSCAASYIPGAESKDNFEIAEEAIKQCNLC